MNVHKHDNFCVYSVHVQIHTCIPTYKYLSNKQHNIDNSQQVPLCHFPLTRANVPGKASGVLRVCVHQQCQMSSADMQVQSRSLDWTVNYANSHQFLEKELVIS